MQTDDPTPQPSTFDVPVIELAGLRLVSGLHPLGVEGARAITLGPLFLVIPLSDENVQSLIQGLTGVIVPASEMPPPSR